MASYALYATASFHGQTVEESFVRTGEALQLGNSPALAVPVPKGMDFLAQVVWTDPGRCRVVSGTGEEHDLTPDENLTITAGPVALHLSLVEQFRLRRTQDVTVGSTLAWVTILTMAALVTVQLDVLNRRYCDITAWAQIVDQRCLPQNASGHAGAYSAEYLARLLRDDLEGEERGVVETEIERPDAERSVEQRMYIPAGAEGPISNMGGAKDTAPEPIRTPEREDIPAPRKKVEEKQPLYAEDVGTPIPLEAEQADPEEGADDGLDLPEATEPDPAKNPAEDVEGWGLPDWYDEQDRRLEQFEIEVTLRRMKQRLRIDPNDPAALQILSYFQYLAGDFQEAEDTYNRIIELFPEDAAGYNNKALVFKRLGRYSEEEGLYRTALYFEPDDVTAMNNLAVNLGHQGRFEEALAIMEQLEVLDPGQPYNDLHRAKIHAEIGNEERALEYLRKALEGMARLDTLHHIEFRQDIRLDPSFDKLRRSERFRSILYEFYGNDTPLQE